MNKPDWFQEKKTFYSFKNLLHLRNLQGLCLKALIFSLFFTLVTLDVLNFDVFVALMKIFEYLPRIPTGPVLERQADPLQIPGSS